MRKSKNLCHFRKCWSCQWGYFQKTQILTFSWGMTQVIWVIIVIFQDFGVSWVDGVSMYIMAMQRPHCEVVGTWRCQWAQGRVSGHKGLSVGTKACQWEHRSVSGNTGLSVGTRACQWTQGSVNGHKSVLLYTKPVNGYKFTLETVHL